MAVTPQQIAAAAAQAAAVWLNKTNPARGQRQLSPWDEMQYFQLPKVTVISPSGWQQIVGTNPNRVGLILSSCTAGNAFASPDDSIGPNVGLNITQPNPPLIITQKDHGILCQMAWFVFASAAPVCAIEIILNQWPSPTRG